MLKDLVYPVTDLNNHSLWVELQNNIINNRKHPPTTPAYKLGEELFHYLKEIHFKIDKIQQCSFMLNFYPHKDTLWLPLTYGEYIEQIMELYIIHSVGLVDRVLHTVNFLYSLNLPKKYITRISVLKKLNSHRVADPLINFIITFDTIRESRNAVVHQFGYTDDELDLITLEDIFRRDEYFNNPKQGFDNQELIKKYQKIVKRLKREMVKNDETLTRRYLGMLDEFAIQYKDRLKEFDSELIK